MDISITVPIIKKVLRLKYCVYNHDYCDLTCKDGKWYHINPCGKEIALKNYELGKNTKTVCDNLTRHKCCIDKDSKCYPETDFTKLSKELQEQVVNIYHKDEKSIVKEAIRLLVKKHVRKKKIRQEFYSYLDII